jgi:hypothetical protein
MGLMQSTTGDGGSFKVFCKYNAKAGRWYTKEDKQDGQEYEVTNMTAVFDLENVRTGWFLFASGVAPAKTYDPSLISAAAKPGDGFKRGFELDIFSEKNLGGVREFSSTAGVVIDAINPLYDAYTAAPEAAQGKLPVVKCVGVTPVTNKHGTNYQPRFEIVSWVDRPAALMGDTPKAPPAAAPVTPAAPAPTAHVPPPAAKPAPAPAMAGGDDDTDF